MIIREVTDVEKAAYNKLASHVIQSWEWGEFRKSTGLDLVRIGHYSGNKLVKAYQLTFHDVPLFKKRIGYFPKGPMPDRDMIRALGDLGKRKGAAFIKIEPLQQASGQANGKLLKLGLVESKKTLFTKYNFIIDLSQTKEALMASFSQKTRYNIGIAQKKGVEVYESTGDADFEIYLKLYFDTTHRQKYFGHTISYHKKVWETLKPAGMARVLVAKYQGEPLVAWMLLSFGDTLYYPYGGSSNKHREVMASNLVCFEAIALGKKMGLLNFDMWGALGPNANSLDPWFGFHRFKAGYGPRLVEYVGTFDLVLAPALYRTLNFADRLRWTFLKAVRR